MAWLTVWHSLFCRPVMKESWVSEHRRLFMRIWIETCGNAKELRKMADDLDVSWNWIDFLGTLKSNRAATYRDDGG